MYSQPTAPRPIGGVLDDAIRLYKASFGRCWPLALIGAVLLGTFSVYTTLRGNVLGSGSATVAGAMAAMARLRAVEQSPGVWGSYVVITLVWLVVRAALITRQDATARDRPDSLGEALVLGLRRLPSMVVAAVIWAAALVAGTILLIVPGIWLWGQLQLWLVAMFVEDIGPLRSLGKSWRLIEGNWWRASTIVGVAFIIILVLSLLEGVAAGVAIAVFKADTVTALIITQLLSILISVFTMPMLTVVMLAIYHDLKLRREGGDLAARLSSLQTA